MNEAQHFSIVHRPHGDCWAHDELPIWIVRYDRTDVRPEFFQAYIATEKPNGENHPCYGGANNKRIGNENTGFKTLEEAAQAAIAKATKG
jgi:hypothetical protein